MFTDVKKLNTFVTIVDEGSFTAAAARLNMAQPWVSVQLRQLEDMLGLSLVERSKGKVFRLSAGGEEFLPIARKLLASCAEATDEINALRKVESNRLVLGVDPITIYIPERNRMITRFMAENPSHDLKIVNRAPNELFAGLDSGEFDLILTSAPDPDGDLEILPLYDYELRLLIPKNNARKYASLDHDGLVGLNLLKLADSYHPAMFSWLRSRLAGSDVRWLDCPELSYQALILYAALLGMATLTPDFSDSIPEMRNEFQVRDLPDRKIRVRWGLMRRTETRSTGAFWRLAQRSPLRLAA